MRFTAATLAAALFVLLGCAAGPYSTAAVCRFTPDPGDGLGGTGASSDVLLRLVGAAEERGIGGTGIVAQNKTDERGLGGTGIIGIVTGFASICVNGYEVEVTDKTTVTVEDLPANLGDVRLGQLVEIEARVQDGQFEASSINVRLAVAGPVSSVSPDGKSMTVAGQTVRMNGFGGSTPETPPALGQWVAVSGLRRADDVVAATSLVALPKAGREVLVAGTVHSEAGVSRIGGLTLSGSGAANGARVVVRGTLDANTVVAAVTAPETSPAFVARVETLSVQGFAGLATPASINLGTLTTPITAEAFSARADLPAHAVQMDGRIVSGVLIPDRVQLLQRPRDGMQVFTAGRPELLPNIGAGTVLTLPQRPIITDGIFEVLPARPETPGGNVGTPVPERPETPAAPIGGATGP